MNIFYLHREPEACAQAHLDKHVTKMIIEYAQLMSTAHRVLDGSEYIDKRLTTEILNDGVLMMPIVKQD